MKTLRKLTAPLIALALSTALAGCDNDVDCGDDGCANPATTSSGPSSSSSTSGPGGAGGAGQGGQGGQGGGDECAIDPPGATFTFHVHNAGNASLWLARGCGGTIPIEVETTNGSEGIGPGSGDFCEVPCESVYAGNANNGCSDCGPGVYDEIAPGATVDVAWDRRVYVSHMAPETCSGSPAGNSCALGVAVDPSAMQKGKLVTCVSMGFGGGCATSDEKSVSFTIDTTKNDAAIEVM